MEGTLLNVPVARTSASKVYKWRSLMFWAERGRVYTVNETTGEAKACSRRDFAQRALVFSDAVKLLKRPDERTDHQRLAERMTDCCRDAFSQGDPHVLIHLKDILHGPRPRSVFGGASFKNDDGGARFPCYPDGTPFLPFPQAAP